jgi:serine protease
VVLNVTATGPTAQSYLTVWPTGQPQPTASNLNTIAGRTTAVRVQVPVGANGQVSIFNAAGSVNVVVDVNGYFTDASNPAATGSEFTPTSPIRVSDTRPDSMLPNAGETLQAGSTITVQVAGFGQIPGDAQLSELRAVVMNATVTNTTAESFLTIWPSGPLPTASDINWLAGRTVANLDVALLNPFGQFQEFNASGSVDTTADVAGWYW